MLLVLHTCKVGLYLLFDVDGQKDNENMFANKQLLNFGMVGYKNLLVAGKVT